MKRKGFRGILVGRLAIVSCKGPLTVDSLIFLIAVDRAIG